MHSIKRIHRLSPLLANQIAAGEVIERPASVIKELLENSLDAGSTQIIIEIEKSGKQLIRVRDNGQGIHFEDMYLAVSAHATSKIIHPEDLEHITSLGFRGEALASIAAVSDFRLVSAIEGSDARELSLEPGQTEAELRLAAHPRGTTIEVRELFKNTPVRRRFLRSDKTELSHIVDIVRKIALSRNDFGITLLHNSETLLQIPMASVIDAAACLRRIQKIIGKSIVEKMLPILEAAEGLSLQGWINSPEYSYPHNDTQYFFLNGRVVRDKVIQHALRVAAQDILPLGRHAAYVLYLECDPSLVDVNVHPTKHEVRFQESRLFHDFIVRALERVWGEKKDLYPIENLQQVSGIAEERGEYVINPSAGGFHLSAKPLALTHERYLLAEIPEGLLIIDLTLWDPTRQKDFQRVLDEVLTLGKENWFQPEIRFICLNRRLR